MLLLVVICCYLLLAVGWWHLVVGCCCELLQLDITTGSIVADVVDVSVVALLSSAVSSFMAGMVFDVAEAAHETWPMI